MVTEEAFNQFAQENIKDPAVLGTPPPTEEAAPETPAPETTPEQTPPVEAAKEEQETQPETSPADEPEKPRDEQGRFVKVSVHAQEMSRRDTIIEEERAKSAALQAELDKLKAAPPKEQQAPKTLAKLEAIKAKLKAEFPEEMQELLTSVEDEFLTRDEQISKLAEAVEVLKQDRETAIQAVKNEVQDDVNSSVDSHPDLKAWALAANRPDATPEAKAIWEAACNAEELLSKMPEWAEKPTAERYAKAAEIAANLKGVQLTKTKAAPVTPTPPAEPKPLPGKPVVPASLSAARPSTTAQTPPAYAGENLSLHGSMSAVKGMTVAQQQKILLGVGT